MKIGPVKIGPVKIVRAITAPETSALEMTVPVTIVHAKIGHGHISATIVHGMRSLATLSAMIVPASSLNATHNNVTFSPVQKTRGTISRAKTVRVKAASVATMVMKTAAIAQLRRHSNLLLRKRICSWRML
jgi:hypothetical protein